MADLLFAHDAAHLLASDIPGKSDDELSKALSRCIDICADPARRDTHEMLIAEIHGNDLFAEYLKRSVKTGEVPA